jgi:hypothetical protein
MNITPRQGDSVILLAICFVVFLVSIGFTIYESVKQTQLTFYGVKTIATCVQIETVGIGRYSRLSYTFRFTNEAGNAIEVKDIAGGWTVKKVGDAIPIVYLPTDSEIVSKSGIEGLGVLFFALSIAFFTGIFMFHWFRS